MWKNWPECGKVTWKNLKNLIEIVNSGKVNSGKENLRVIPIGFEPMTYSLEGCRSIQLSYGTG